MDNFLKTLHKNL